MWEVKNYTPFAAQGYFSRDRNGVEHWCIAVRASFKACLNGFVSLRSEQQPVRLVPLYVGPDAQELLAESDFAPFRPQADILVHGKICTQDGQLADLEQNARLRVGVVDKRIVAIVRRVIRRIKGQWQVFGGDPFDSVPLTWRHAIGGKNQFAEDNMVHPFNPIGAGWAKLLSEAPDGAQMDLPRIESPEHYLDLDKPWPLPTGMGAIQPAWRPRLDYAGTYDEAWLNHMAPLPPTDFSEAFHQTAPPDQVYPTDLKGGEPVELEGFHPEGPYAFRLPQLILEARTVIDKELTVHRFRIVQVEFDTIDKSVFIVLNASLPCRGGDHRLKSSSVILRQMAGVTR